MSDVLTSQFIKVLGTGQRAESFVILCDVEVLDLFYAL